MKGDGTWGVRPLDEINQRPPGRGSSLHPEGWDIGPVGPGRSAQDKVSYGVEQRVWAVCYLNPEMHDRSGWATRKIHKLMVRGSEYSRSTVNRAIRQLEAKGVVNVQRSERHVFWVCMVDAENAPHSWAVRELREQIEQRQKNRGSKPAVVVVPKDYQATPEHLRNKVEAAYEKLADDTEVTYAPPLSLDEPRFNDQRHQDSLVDYGKLADDLLVKVTRILSAPPPAAKPDPKVQAELDEAKRYAFILEGQVKAAQAQVAQLEKNLEAAVEAAKTLDEQNRVWRSRFNRLAEQEKHRDRNYRITEQMSPESREALKKLAEGK